uniref:Uncharacterized protein n=1 Tax=Mycena chlorophos TaxID=658473 RepID=A0ABQ0LLB2_MYCCL|nr:predicted protein [Mycena chlorophos]
MAPPPPSFLVPLGCQCTTRERRTARQRDGAELFLSWRVAAFDVAAAGRRGLPTGSAFRHPTSRCGVWRGARHVGLTLPNVADRWWWGWHQVGLGRVCGDTRGRPGQNRVCYRVSLSTSEILRNDAVSPVRSITKLKSSIIPCADISYPPTHPICRSRISLCWSWSGTSSTVT